MIVKIEPSANGGHANQSTTPGIVPDGWAIVPEDMVVPATFPFVEIVAKDGIVISMTEGVVPEPKPMPVHVPTLTERVATLEAENASLREQVAAQDALLKELIGT